jgi:chromate transporter
MVLLKLFLIFVKIGFLGFGGGYAIITMIQKELTAMGWISAEEFANIAAISQMTPGPIAVNAATYVGYRVGGFWGSALATFGVSVPSFVLVVLAAHFILKFKESRTVEACMRGIRPVTIALIASACIFFAYESFVDLTLPLLVNPGAFAIFVLAILASVLLKMDTILIIILSAVLGLVIL